MGDTAYADSYRNIDFRQHPGKYKVGRGEQGVLTAEPYKSEILPHWRFADVPAATKYAGDKSVRPQAKDWEDSEKAQAAKVFYAYYSKAKSDKRYLELKAKHLGT